MAQENRTVSFRPARVFAMQLLYAMEITGETVAQALPGVLAAIPDQDTKPFPDEQKKYGMKLVDLVLEHKAELEETMKANSVHWELERIARIDRILLSIAMVELSYIPDIPMKVAITEAVQIASKYSTDNSGSFVNGMLAGYLQNRGNAAPESKEN